MPILKQASLSKITLQFGIIVFAMTLLFSCRKDTTVGNSLEAVSPSISLNASNRTSTVAIPFDDIIFVDCANGGAGEYVHITGRTNLLYTISWTDHGFTFGYHSNTYNIKGVGLSSGQTFAGSGNTEAEVMGAWVNAQWISNFVDKLILVGGNTNFIVRSKYHVLVNPDGTVEVDNDDNVVECN